MIVEPDRLLSLDGGGSGGGKTEEVFVFQDFARELQVKAAAWLGKEQTEERDGGKETESFDFFQLQVRQAPDKKVRL